MKSTLAIALMASVAAGVPCAAAQHPQLQAGIRQVEQGDIETAAATFALAAQQLSADAARAAELSLTLAYLALVHQGLGEPATAHTHMVEAVRHSPGLVLDPSRFPPRVLELLESVKSELSPPAASTLPEPGPEAVTAPVAVAPVRLPGVARGSRVRLSAPATAGRSIVGTITAIDAGTLTIRGEGGSGTFSIPVADAQRLEVSAGKASSRKRALLAGLGGAVLFGAAGMAYGGAVSLDPACVSFFSDNPEALAAFGGTLDTLCGGEFGVPRGKGKWGGLGAVAGAALGAVIGVVTAQEVWRPSDRVAVGVTPASGGVWVALSF